MNGTNYEVSHCAALSTTHSQPSWAQILPSLLKNLISLVLNLDMQLSRCILVTNLYDFRWESNFHREWALSAIIGWHSWGLLNFSQVKQFKIHNCGTRFVCLSITINLNTAIAYYRLICMGEAARSWLWLAVHSLISLNKVHAAKNTANRFVRVHDFETRGVHM